MICGIYLDRLKSDHNLGLIMRLAHCYGVKYVATCQTRYGSQRFATDTTYAAHHLPLFEDVPWQSMVAKDMQVVVVERIATAKSLCDFVHPKNALYVFGPEDGNVADEIVKNAYDVVEIPSVVCLNVAMTVGTVLYDRLLKRERQTFI